MSYENNSLKHLFESLKQEHNADVFSADKKETLLKNISLLDEKGCEMLYIIIKYHQLESKPNSIDILPYESKFVSKQLRFDIEKLPNDLKFIISKFVASHLEEEKIRQTREGILSM